ncbi:hypothetical protein [Methylobacterium platani]|uniref:Uncharacterized protein n=2 Tax=Methylobacterium platani TaxID=427683 RepID=A0A179S6J4_9HYPH|nr:hypothetical protein [Methylobacterium platani]KMO21049.1 hypothetical protein SQ03_04195 [Methylobacterium platani JCM 14648]OAS22827.1 hypothetical protein A5481_18450 [Methylobacterium platani]
MMRVTNHAAGPRLVWPKGARTPRLLVPGESAVIALPDRTDPCLAAWAAAGEMRIEAAEPGEDPPQQDPRQNPRPERRRGRERPPFGGEA